MTTALEGGEGSASRPGRFLPPGKTRYPLYRRLGGPQGRSGQAQKISPPTGIRSPNRPARSQSLYRLSYPAHRLVDKYLRFRQQSCLHLTRKRQGNSKLISYYSNNSTNKMQFFKSLLLDVYLWLNMFRASPRPLLGAYNCTRSLWFYRWKEEAEALLVVVWQVK
jgi:hypothetical protein